MLAAISEKWAGQHDVAQIKAAMQDVEYYISSVYVEVCSHSCSAEVTHLNGSV